MPFVKGDPNINRNGRPRNSEIDQLREALAKESEKRGVDFWDKVAEKAFKDTTIMIAVLKKFVPDTTFTKLEGDIGKENRIIIVRANGQDNHSSGEGSKTDQLPGQVRIQPE